MVIPGGNSASRDSTQAPARKCERIKMKESINGTWQVPVILPEPSKLTFAVMIGYLLREASPDSMSAPQIQEKFKARFPSRTRGYWCADGYAYH